MDQHSHEMSRRALIRRATLTGATLVGVGTPVLAACGSDPDTAGPAGPTGGDGTSGTSASPGDAPGAGTTVATSDVPVQGGTILTEEKVVVTQPSEGEFKAFSAVCTHQGCPVQAISDGKITCDCHGSAFSIEDGSVVRGPATRPLESLPISVGDSEVTVG
jgi:Rieske Fe-S protein